MGRLQRKKPVSKKKKKKQNSDNLASAQMGSAATEKKGLTLAGFSKDIPKKSLFSKKKSVEAGKVAKKTPGESTIAKGMQFLREVRIELKKVTWPPRNQTIGSTIVVIVLVMIISLFLGVVDIGLSNLVRVVLR